ncbi:MAG: hypothetical protein D6734_00295 [Candidatus Schekmanbacteria bacterium]|nr:MAG: hypothetical protein D6734_00295 [Candidatus Schekmanbacteria bacterium]
MDKVSGVDFKSTNLDIILAIAITGGLPFLCKALYDLTGALLPILVYYGFCWGIAFWRKGTADYYWPEKMITPLFVILFVLMMILIASAAFVTPIAEGYERSFSFFMGFAFTLVVWCTINAFSEQLLWIYIYDAFANRFESKGLKILGHALGLIFFWGFIGLIHVIFWTKFLLGMEPVSPYFAIFMFLQYPITIGYLIIYRKGRSMWPIAILHFLQDIGGVIAAKYSILPYLFK